MTFSPQTILPAIRVSLLMISVTCIAASSFAQGVSEQGKITYNQTINIHASLAPEQAALKALVRKEQTIQIQAAFSGDAYRLKNTSSRII